MQSNGGKRNQTGSGRFKFVKMNSRVFLPNILNEQIRLFTIPISLGIIYISYQKYKQRKDQRIRQPVSCAEPNLVTDIEVSFLFFLIFSFFFFNRSIF